MNGEPNPRDRAGDHAALFERAVAPIADVRAASDGSPTVRAVNDAFRATFGTDPSGRPVGDVSRPEMGDVERDLVASGLDGRSDSDVVRRETADERRDFRVRAIPATGAFDGVYLRYEDVTDRRQHEQQVDVLTRVLRHDLRNGLNVVLGHAGVIREATTDPQVQAAGEEIETAASELLALGETANDLPGASETPGTVDLRDVLRGSCCEVRQYDDGISVRVDLPPGPVPVDATLERAIDALLWGVVEHSEGGPSLSVTASVRNGDAVLEVVDEAGTVPEPELAALSGSEETPLQHATGLDLWLVHWTVTEVGGTVDVETDDGSCRVRLGLPLCGEGVTAEGDVDERAQGNHGRSC